jgi:molecular chaperone HscB
VLAPLEEHSHPCWRCGQPNQEQEQEQAPSLFCRYCNSLQAPKPDYFRFFGITKRLVMDEDDLQRRFYSLSRLLHPDRYTRSSENERIFSLEATAILNDGYRTLRNSVSRAEYVLREAGFDIGEQRTKDVPPELLEEVFELNMTLDELRSGDDDVLPQLIESRAHFGELLAEIDESMQRSFESYDIAPEDARQAVLANLRAILNRRRYIRNLISEVDKELAGRQA